MDSTRFDAFSRKLAVTSSRRGAVRTMAAAGLGLGLARVGLEVAAAGGKKKVTARCSDKDQCANGLKCKTSNSQNSCYAKSEKRCCKPVGATCNDGCECCGIDVICNGGYCDKA